MGASTDSNINRSRLKFDYAPTADFNLLLKAYETTVAMGLDVRIGNVFSTDQFYFSNDPERWKSWIEYGIIGAEMETSILYSLAAKFKVQALSLLTVSDNILTGEASDPKSREYAIGKIAEIGLSLI